MATQPETIEFLLNKLHSPERFSTKRMFGEYALYADGKVVGFVCDDLLYVKILPASVELENVCEKGPPYPGAKLYYIVEEVHLSTIENLTNILLAIGESIPAKKKSPRKKKSR
jgi:TfoX/Sxy family transcriptional regulator of competence genes